MIDTFMALFGNHIPLVRRQDMKGNQQRNAHWIVRAVGVEAVRAHAAQMERDSERFYRLAASRTKDAAVVACWATSPKQKRGMNAKSVLPRRST